MVPTSAQRSKSYGKQTYAQSHATSSTPWSGQAQDWPQSPRQSPRNARQPRRRGRNQGKGGGAKGQQGKTQQGNAQTAQQMAPPPPPPLGGPHAVAAPWTTMPTAPGTNKPATETAAEKKFNEVMNLLNKQSPDTLPSDLQVFVQKEGAIATKVSAKQLHSAVDVVADAEKAMDAALNSRTNLISSWRTFLAASFVTWKEYTEQFQQQEAKCQEEIRNAREVLEKAKQDFEQKKPRPEKEQAHFISDDEDAKDEVAKESTQRILSGLQNMTNNLTELSAQAEFEFQEAQRRKRPRKTSKGDEATPAEDGAHFGAPGQWQPSGALTEGPQPYTTQL